MTKDPTFTKIELQTIHRNLTRVLPPGGQPLTDPAEILLVNGAIAKARIMIDASLPTVERGHRVLAWRVPIEAAPSMNDLARWLARQKWRAPQAKQWLEAQIARMKDANPVLDLCGAQKQRQVRVTRFTAQPKNVDDAATDAIGGKLPVDMLKKAGVFVDDKPKWLIREAVVRKTKLGNTHVLIEVFEVADEQVPGYDEPEDGEAPASPWKKSKTTEHIEGDKPPKKSRVRTRSSPLARQHYAEATADRKAARAEAPGLFDESIGVKRALPFGDDS